MCVWILRHHLSELINHIFGIFYAWYLHVSPIIPLKIQSSMTDQSNRFNFNGTIFW